MRVSQPRPQAPPATCPPPDPAPAVRKSRLVLVVDDSRAQRRVLATVLKRWGYRVIEAESGQAALALCRAHPVEIILSDWMMPGMSGLEFCRQFRALPRAGYGYFVLLTARNSSEEVAEGLEVGADDFLGKPVNLNELRARIRAGERILRMEEELKAKNHALQAALARVQNLNNTLEHDLQEARALQQALVRERSHRFGPFAVNLLLQPSGHVGGDMIGVIDAGGDSIGLYAIDVSGHGIASALMTARLVSYLSGDSPGQNIALEGTRRGQTRLRPPDQVADSLNRLLLEEMKTDHYFTLLYATLHVPSARLEMVQAGHPHPMLLRSGGDVTLLGEGGLPIGLLPEARHESFEVVLRPGDRLLICSDGISECRDIGGAILGEAALARLMRHHAALGAGDFLDALLWELEARTGREDFADDISAVLVDYRPEAG
jgi:sigma-B regulation protein RsbU (phosphoserine phosphatase)